MDPKRADDHFARLEQSTASARAAVVDHPIYGAVRDARALRLFMRSHVFAVWDFMSLLKALQRLVTCVEVPWLPPPDPGAARLVNTIVLGEESDEIAPGRPSSHYELYLAAMVEVGADTSIIEGFVGALRAGRAPRAALEELGAPRSAQRFVRSTLAICGRGPAEVAAAFLLGREELVPAMFRALLAELERDGLRCAAFRLYLERHVEVDTGQHGPMARRLLVALCGDDEARWRAATGAARQALEARRALWDGVLASMRA